MVLCNKIFFFSVVLDPRVDCTLNSSSPLDSVSCHSKWLRQSESCPCLDVVQPGRTRSSSGARSWHCTLHDPLFQTVTLFPYSMPVVRQFPRPRIDSILTWTFSSTRSLVFFAVHETRRIRMWYRAWTLYVIVHTFECMPTVNGTDRTDAQASHKSLSMGMVELVNLKSNRTYFIWDYCDNYASHSVKKWMKVWLLRLSSTTDGGGHAQNVQMWHTDKISFLRKHVPLFPKKNAFSQAPNWHVSRSP